MIKLIKIRVVFKIIKPFLSSASYENKQRLQKLIFPSGILYNKQKGEVRTSKINSLFAQIEPLERGLSKKKKGNPDEDCLKSSSVPRISFSSNNLTGDINRILAF